MKKFLFASAALALVATTANAQNLVVNGSFNEPGYEQEKAYDWIDGISELTSLPGWTLETGGKWNGVAMVVTDEPGDDDPRPEEDEVYLSLWGYNDNGWTTVSVNQIVKGLEVGKEYVFKYQYDYNFPDASMTLNQWAPDPSYGAALYEVDGDNAGKTIKEYANPNGDERSSGMWLQFETTFTAPAEQVYLKLYLGNTYGDKNKKDDLYFDIDNVEIYDADMSGVAEIEVADAPVEFFNLQGMRVNAADAQKGIFIKKQGNKVSKVAL